MQVGIINTARGYTISPAARRLRIQGDAGTLSRVALVAFISLVAFVALGALRAGGTRVALGALRASRSLLTLRAGHTLQHGDIHLQHIRGVVHIHAVSGQPLLTEKRARQHLHMAIQHTHTSGTHLCQVYTRRQGGYRQHVRLRALHIHTLTVYHESPAQGRRFRPLRQRKIKQQPAALPGGQAERWYRFLLHTLQKVGRVPAGLRQTPCRVA